MESEKSSRGKGIYKVAIVGSVVNFLLFVFKFFAGTAGHSAAMLADAIHSLSDSITDIVATVFVRVAGKSGDKRHNYKYGKYEISATAIIGLLLSYVGSGIFWNGASSIYTFLQGGQLESLGVVALVTALVSIMSGEILYQYIVIQDEKLNSQAVVANVRHHRSDALSSIGTAIDIGGAILLGDHWRVLDPIAAVIISLFIVKVSVRLLIPCMDELPEKSLLGDVEKEIEQTMLSFPGVGQPHHLRTRRVGGYYIIETHIRVGGKITLEEVYGTATAIENRLKEIFGKGVHVDIHVGSTK